MSRRLDDPQVRVTTHTNTDVPPACENCHTPNEGVNAVHWSPQDEPFGLLCVCDEKSCLDFAVGTALDDAPTDTEVLVEHTACAAVLGVAA